MIKTVSVLCFLLASNVGFSQQTAPTRYDNVVTDLRTAFAWGTRPLSLGRSRYFDAQGSFTTTWYQEDFAVQGKGFFRIEDRLTGKVSYTRNGRFKKVGSSYFTADGRIVTSKMDFSGKNNHPNVEPIPNRAVLYLPSDESTANLVNEYEWSAPNTVAVDTPIVSGALEMKPESVLELASSAKECLAKLSSVPAPLRKAIDADIQSIEDSGIYTANPAAGKAQGEEQRSKVFTAYGLLLIDFLKVRPDGNP